MLKTNYLKSSSAFTVKWITCMSNIRMKNDFCHRKKVFNP